MKQTNIEQKNKLVSFRLTQTEKEKLDELVNEFDVKNVSDFIRQIIIFGKFKTTKQTQNFEKLLYEINKIGNNINQIARLCNIENQLHYSNVIDVKVLEKLAKIEEELSILIEECEC